VTNAQASIGQMIGMSCMGKPPNVVEYRNAKRRKRNPRPLDIDQKNAVIQAADAVR
jgi:hypothetical protein